MISRIALRWRWLRRMVSRNLWSARLLGVRSPPGEASEPGLILIQIDGLGRAQFERALHDNRLPFLHRLIRQKHFDLETFYSGVPSTTPAVQGEIFFGVRAAVPSFQFMRRDSGRVVQMNEPTPAAESEDELLARCPRPLLSGASVYSNIFRGGAAHSCYCSRDLAPQEILRRLNPLKAVFLCIIYSPRFVRLLALAVVEFILAILDAVKGLYEREDVFREIAFIPGRVAVCVVLREMIRFRVLLDIERGVRIIQANFLGYDEQAHRRGPGSAFAHWCLKDIDRAVRDIYRAANGSSYRDYELMVYSDHGQEKSIPYFKKNGRELNVALAEVFSRGPLADTEFRMRGVPELLGNTVNRCREWVGLVQAPATPQVAADPSRQIVVTALGPLGHLYFPSRLTISELESYASRLVDTAHIPLVLFPTGDGTTTAFNRRGKWSLPADRGEVLGAAHPFPDEAAEDLVRLCAHRDAGDLVISGWDPLAAPLTFVMENGAHGGPGIHEIQGFLLVPDRIRRWHLAHLPATRKRVRGEDLRTIVMHYLADDGVREERVSESAISAPTNSIRVMTYNIHSCVGIDGKIRPERVARVINHCDPDIVAVQEVDCHRHRSGGKDQAQLIADHLRMSHVFLALFEEQTERYGIAIFSKYPMKLMKSGNLTEAEPLRFREARGAIWVKVENGDRDGFHFINTHFGLKERERSRQLQELTGPGWLGAIPPAEPVILCGDFNMGPNSKVFRLLKDLRDAQRVNVGFKPRATFSSVNPFLRLDHVFLSDHFDVKSVEVPDSPTAVVASDHLPVCVALTLSNGHD